MSKTLPHLIHKVSLDITVKNKEQAYSIKNNISAFLAKEVFPDLEQYFKELQQKTQQFAIRLENIRLDISVEQLNLNKSLKYEILESFKQQVRESFNDITTNTTKGKSEKTLPKFFTQEQHELATLVYFIEQGIAPWWQPENSLTPLLEGDKLKNLVKEPVFKTQFLKLLVKETVQQRLLYQFSSSSLLAIILLFVADKDKNGFEDKITNYVIHFTETQKNIFFKSIFKIILNEKIATKKNITNLLAQFEIENSSNFESKFRNSSNIDVSTKSADTKQDKETISKSIETTPNLEVKHKDAINLDVSTKSADTKQDKETISKSIETTPSLEVKHKDAINLDVNAKTSNAELNKDTVDASTETTPNLEIKHKDATDLDTSEKTTDAKIDVGNKISNQETAGTPTETSLSLDVSAKTSHTKKVDTEHKLPSQEITDKLTEDSSLIPTDTKKSDAKVDLKNKLLAKETTNESYNEEENEPKEKVVGSSSKKTNKDVDATKQENKKSTPVKAAGKEKNDAQKDSNKLTEYSEATDANFSASENNYFITEKELHLKNAGLVLVYPFLSHLFKHCALVDEQKKITQPALAVHILHYLATGNTQQAESDLLFEKFLCNIPFEMPIPRFVEITEAHKEHVHKLLDAVKQNWSAMSTSSHGLLRNEFLQRTGKLEFKNNSTTITIERKTHDILLNKLSWGISMVRLPWKKGLVYVNWS